jgi:hypothetical protein
MHHQCISSDVSTNIRAASGHSNGDPRCNSRRDEDNSILISVTNALRDVLRAGKRGIGGEVLGVARPRSSVCRRELRCKTASESPALAAVTISYAWRALVFPLRSRRSTRASRLRSHHQRPPPSSRQQQTTQDVTGPIFKIVNEETLAG